MKSIKDINTATPEGKMLWAAIIVLTQSPAVKILGERIRGNHTEPDVMVQKLQKLVVELKDDFPNPKAVAGTDTVKDTAAGAGGEKTKEEKK